MERPRPEELLKHARFLRALAYRLVGDDARADDLVQEAYIAALEKPPRGALKAWLGAVVRNLAGKMHRSEGRRHAREQAATRPAPLPRPDDVAQRIELHKKLVQAVDELEEPYRATIVLRFFYDLKPREVAARLSIPVETVRTRTQRALEKLRGRIDRKALALALLPLPALKSAAASPALTWGIVMETKRRVVLVLCLLVLATGGSLALLAGSGAEPARHADARQEPPPEAPGAVEAKDAPASDLGDDDDPNRTPGPELVARGLVLLGDAPVAGAQVTLRRADPPVALFDPTTRSYRWLTESLREPLDETRTDAAGRFELRCSHRTKLAVEARAAGAAPARVLVRAPLAGDVTIRLRHAGEIEGKVVDESGAPVPGATVRWRAWGEREAPVRGETATDDAGAFRIPGGRRFLRMLVKASGFAPASSSRPERIVLERGGRVTGVVTTAEGAPVADAVVLLATSAPGGTRTDASGRYALRLPEGHLVHALVDAPGRLPLGSWTEEIALPPRPVEAGANLAFDVTLPSAVPLRGAVVDDRDPVAVARVTLLRMTSRWPVAVGYTTSDADGLFAFAAVPEGAYELRASSAVLRGKAPAHVLDEMAPEPVTVEVAKTGRIEGRVNGDLAVAEVRLEGGGGAKVGSQGRFVFEHAEPTDATCVHVPHTTVRTESFAVGPGETVRVTLDTTSARLLRGRVVDTDGAPLADALVGLFEKRDYLHRNVELYGLRERGVRTGADGRFAVPLLDGPAILVAWHPEAAPARLESVDPDAGDMTVTLQPGDVFSGHVVWSDGAAVEGARLRVRVAERRARVAITDSSWRELSRGAFELRGLGARVLEVEVRHPHASTVRAVLEPGTRDASITLRRALSIRGAVVDAAGRPVSAAKITARSRGRPDAVAHSTHLGRFEVAGLDEGAYDLHLEPGTKSDWYPPRLMPFEPEVVTGVAAGTQDVVVTVDTGGTVSGVVLGPDGRRVARAFVAALSSPGRIPPFTRTGAGGRFTLTGVTGEHEELLVVARDLPARTVPLGKGDLEIRIDAGESLRIRLLDPDGAPVANLWVSASVTTAALVERTKEWRARLGEARRSAGSIAGRGARTDANGRVELRGLIPGEYRVHVSETEAGLLPKTVVRTGAAEHTVRLEPAYRITGTVVDPDGDPVGSDPGKLWINVGAYRGETHLGHAVVSEDGTFEIARLTAGPVLLRVAYSGVPPGYRGETTAYAGATNVRVVVTRQE